MIEIGKISDKNWNGKEDVQWHSGRTQCRNCSINSTLCARKVFQLITFRTCYSKIWHLSILQVLSWVWESSRKTKVTLTFHLPFSPETGYKTLMWVVFSLYLEESSFFNCANKGMPRRTQKLALLSFLSFTTFNSYSLTYIHPQLSTLYQS